MSEKLEISPVSGNQTSRDESAGDIDAIAWAVLFIWAGTTLLIHAGLGGFLLGLGAIMTGAELARLGRGQRIDGFWLACGIVSLIAGALEYAHLSWRLAPVLLIVLGVGVILNVILSRQFPKY